MGIHQYKKKILPDNEFVLGNIAYLKEGNQCRLLDARRTPGFIEDYFTESAIFRWRITDFEDKGKYWDVPAENIDHFQVGKLAKKLNEDKINEINKTIAKYQDILNIKINEKESAKTESAITHCSENIEKWLKKYSKFIKSKKKLNLKKQTGPVFLSDDLLAYMQMVEMGEMEGITSRKLVQNPHYWEWIKGMRIILGEMGLVLWQIRLLLVQLYSLTSQLGTSQMALG